MMTDVKERAFVKRMVFDMLFQHILVPVDLSTKSTRAFKVALDIAKKYNSKLSFLVCLEMDKWHRNYFDARANLELVKKQKKIAKKYFEKLESLAEKHNIFVQSRILTSESPANTIVHFAKLKKCDLVVIGSRRQTRFIKFTASIANSVSQKTNCPVLIIK